MNEQIQKLAKQAGAHWNHGDFNMGSSVEFQESDLEKFAELIVEECVSQCWSVSEMEHKGNVISECSKRMRKHFGVE